MGNQSSRLGGLRNRGGTRCIGVLLALVVAALPVLAVSAANPVSVVPTRAPGAQQGSGVITVLSRPDATQSGSNPAPTAQLRTFEYTPNLCTPTSSVDTTYTASYYTNNKTSGSMYTTGQNLYQAFGSSGRDCAVILDFGQASTMGATNPPYVEGVNLRAVGNPNYVFTSNTTVMSLVESFIQGYLSVTQTPPMHLTLVLGVNLVCTNNSIIAGNCACPNTNTCIVDDYFHHGTEWAFLVQSVNSYVQSTWGTAAHISVQGGADIETNFNTAFYSTSWVNGFAQSGTNSLLFDYGDAGGCPATGGGYDPHVNYQCGDSLHNWHQHDVWYMSWGSPVSYPIPEIYFDVAPFPMAAQWAQLSQYAQAYEGSIPITFAGVLTQYNKCKALGFPSDPTVGCVSSGHNTLDPYTALTELQGAVNQTISWSTDIVDLP